ncbi:MAG: ABC transporter permease [Coxiellaceae bacterium]|nr:ABC transporter permease [Coxiellaceae bacterium]
MIVFIVSWQLIVLSFNFPAYILPSPILVLSIFKSHGILILQHSLPTLIEAFIGMIVSIFLGIVWALFLVYFSSLRLWFLPLLIISQALPVFAIAPLLVIWFGYGIISRVIIITLMLFFPIASSFYDGLCRTPSFYLDLAQTMNASKLQVLIRIRIPYALPSFCSGLRLAATFAPIGAVMGEWIGSSHGLGFLILNANSQMQIDLMFAAILILSVLTMSFYGAIDFLIKCLSNSNI